MPQPKGRRPNCKFTSAEDGAKCDLSLLAHEPVVFVGFHAAICDHAGPLFQRSETDKY